MIYKFKHFELSEGGVEWSDPAKRDLPDCFLEIPKWVLDYCRRYVIPNESGEIDPFTAGRTALSSLYISKMTGGWRQLEQEAIRESIDDAENCQEKYPDFPMNIFKKIEDGPTAVSLVSDRCFKDWLEFIGCDALQVFPSAALAAHTLKLLDCAASEYLSRQYDVAFNVLAEASRVSLIAADCVQYEEVRVIRGQAQLQRRGQAKQGAKERHRQHQALREQLVKLYQEGSWSSPHQASHELKDEAVVRAKRLGRPLSMHRAQRTIYDWFLNAERESTNPKR